MVERASAAAGATEWAAIQQAVGASYTSEPFAGVAFAGCSVLEATAEDADNWTAELAGFGERRGGGLPDGAERGTGGGAAAGGRAARVLLGRFEVVEVNLVATEEIARRWEGSAAMAGTGAPPGPE